MAEPVKCPVCVTDQEMDDVSDGERACFACPQCGTTMLLEVIVELNDRFRERGGVLSDAAVLSEAERLLRKVGLLTVDLRPNALGESVVSGSRQGDFIPCVAPTLASLVMNLEVRHG